MNLKSLKYKRLDYPGHCSDIKRFDSLNKFESKGDLSNNIRVLIVVNQLYQPLHLDPAVNLCFSLVRKKYINVDILYANENRSTLQEWKTLKVEHQIESSSLIKLPRDVDVLKSPIADELEDSYHLNNWLNGVGEKYQIIISLERSALFYYPLLSRKTLKGHSTKKFIVFSKSSSYFNLIKSSKPAFNLSLLNRFYSEQQVIELSDYFISNSQHYLKWMNENEINTKSNNIYCHQIPYFFPTEKLTPKQLNSESKGEWVFVFGHDCDTEIIFCIETIRRMKLLSVSCKFLLAVRLPSKRRRHFQRLAKDLRIELIQANKNCFQWMKVLQQSTLAVVPNKETLSPSLVSLIYMVSNNVLANGYDEELNDIRTFNHNPEVIKGYLDNAIVKKNDINSRVCSFDFGWVGLINSIVQTEQDVLPTKAIDSFKITVCISHYNRGKMLLRAIESIKNQTYSPHEIIVVDDGSNDKETLQVLSDLEKNIAGLNIQILKQNNLYIGASRNKGLEAATGDYILFMDDDNEAKPNELEVFVQAANELNADVLTCFSEVFSGQNPQNSEIPRQHALFVGPNMNCSLLSNPFGDSNMFVKIEAIRSIGGFSEYFKTGRDDHEFFVRACLNGLNVQLVPKILYDYRLSKNRIRNSHINLYSGLSRVMQSYSQKLNVLEAQQLRYSQGVSYAIGPWGTSLRSTFFKHKIIEFGRMYVAKFPKLYNLAMKLKGRDNN